MHTFSWLLPRSVYYQGIEILEFFSLLKNEISSDFYFLRHFIVIKKGIITWISFNFGGVTSHLKSHCLLAVFLPWEIFYCILLSVCVAHVASGTKAHQNQLYLWQATAAVNKYGLGSSFSGTLIFNWGWRGTTQKIQGKRKF